MARYLANDAFENSYISFQTGLFWVSMLVFRGIFLVDGFPIFKQGCMATLSKNLLRDRKSMRHLLNAIAGWMTSPLGFKILVYQMYIYIICCYCSGVPLTIINLNFNKSVRSHHMYIDTIQVARTKKGWCIL